MPSHLSYKIDDFLQLENDVWQSLVTGDASTDAELLDEHFLGVYSSGFAGRDDHVGQLKNGPTIAAFALFEPRLMVLASETVLLSYRAQFTPRNGDIVDIPETMYVTSIWKRIDGQWKNIFSQDTNSEGE